LAQALIHDPEILILDEPTSGLDPLQILEIRDLIKSLAGNKTLIFSTHILQEVSPVTDRVVVINEGRIIADGQIRELARQAMGTNRIFAGFRQTAEEVEETLRQEPAFGQVTRLVTQDTTDSRFEIRGGFDADLTGTLARLAHKMGWELSELHQSEYTLEDTFIALTRQSQGGRKEVA
jgi:ABC-2 type transport system ATP-binding protein